MKFHIETLIIGGSLLNFTSSVSAARVPSFVPRLPVMYFCVSASKSEFLNEIVGLEHFFGLKSNNIKVLFFPELLQCLPSNIVAL